MASEAQPGDAQPGHAQPGHAHRERPQTALTQSTPQPAASGKAEREFVALAEAAMLPTPAVMQVVQVSVRAQRLAELGIACPGDREEVAAEVLVGDDGIARALRVVGE